MKRGVDERIKKILRDAWRPHAMHDWNYQISGTVGEIKFHPRVGTTSKEEWTFFVILLFMINRGRFCVFR